MLVAAASRKLLLNRVLLLLRTSITISMRLAVDARAAEPDDVAVPAHAQQQHLRPEVGLQRAAQLLQMSAPQLLQSL